MIQPPNPKPNHSLYDAKEKPKSSPSFPIEGAIASHLRSPARSINFVQLAARIDAPSLTLQLVKSFKFSFFALTRTESSQTEEKRAHRMLSCDFKSRSSAPWSHRPSRCGLEKLALLRKRCSITLRARLVRRCHCCPPASATAPLPPLQHHADIE